jgi:hypothetical protein
MRSARNDRSDFFGRFVILLLALLCVSTIVEESLNGICIYCTVSESVFALCVLAGLVCLRKHCGLSFGVGARALHHYAFQHGFLKAWMYGSLRKFLIISVAWLLSVIGHAAPFLFTSDTRDSLISTMVTFALVAGFFSMQIYFVLHICCFLELMVDAFCVRLFTEGSFSKGIYAWNAVQAILRRSAGVVEVCFFILQASIVMGLGLISAEIIMAEWDGDTELSLIGIVRFLGWLPMAFLMLYCLFKAAEVTGKCRKLPTLVNSLIRTPEETINLERQYMVDFIVQSEAGFYVFGMRLTVFMVFKCSYVLVLVSFSVVSQLRGRAPRLRHVGRQ